MKKPYEISPAIPKNHSLLEHHSQLISQLLYNRGITTQKSALHFLEPTWDENYDPFLMFNIKEGVARLHQAVQNNEKITIYADYDADGIPGAVILAELLDFLEHKNYEIYIPHRHNEGYGLHVEALEEIKRTGSTLVITIDVGITAHQSSVWCLENNLDLIITDHHEPSLEKNGKQNLPKPYLLINPKQSKCSYPDDMICGCAVIFKFIQGFIREYQDEYIFPDGFEKWLLDMVGLSTISDMVPLRNENRLFAMYGLRVIAKTKRVGLKSLINKSNINLESLTEQDIAFGITPRINAASRISHPNDALFTLLEKNINKANDFAIKLDILNSNRKNIVSKSMEQVHQILSNKTIKDLIVVGSPNLNIGILGLIASELVRKYNVPAFVWSKDKETIKGSCRSAKSVNLLAVMNSTESNTFIQFGGHAEAGGFSVDPKNITDLEEKLHDGYSVYIKENGTPKPQPQNVDMELILDNASIETYREIRKLAPFGQSNIVPVFLFKNIVPQTIESFGKEKNHLKIWFQKNNGERIAAIKFFATRHDYGEKIQLKKPLDLLASLEYSTFKNNHEIRLDIKNIF